MRAADDKPTSSTTSSTIPQPAFARASEIDPDDVLWRNQYLAATCFVLECDRSLIPYYWLNINNPAFPLLAIVEHTNMVDRNEYGARHVIYVGNYVPRDDWRFTTDPAELLESYISWLRELNPGFDGHGSSTGTFPEPGSRSRS